MSPGPYLSLVDVSAFGSFATLQVVQQVDGETVRIVQGKVRLHPKKKTKTHEVRLPSERVESPSTRFWFKYRPVSIDVAEPRSRRNVSSLG